MADPEIEDVQIVEHDDVAEQPDTTTDEQPNLAADGSEEEFSIEIDGEEAEEEEPLIKSLRQINRDQARELAEHRKAQQPKIEVGEKPTLEGCDYDEEKFEADLTAWHDRKRAADSQEADATKQAEVRNQEFQRKAINYKTKLEALPIPADQKAAAEKTIIAALPELLQSAIISYADDPAKVVVALAKHPAKLQQLAQEQDPIRFILAMKDLERNLKVVTKKKPPAPDAENVVSGSAAVSHNTDKEEQRLWKKYEQSNSNADLDAYRSYQRERRKKAA
jgi:hypothetical protein